MSGRLALVDDSILVFVDDLPQKPQNIHRVCPVNHLDTNDELFRTGAEIETLNHADVIAVLIGWHHVLHVVVSVVPSIKLQESTYGLVNGLVEEFLLDLWDDPNGLELVFGSWCEHCHLILPLHVLNQQPAPNASLVVLVLRDASERLNFRVFAIALGIETQARLITGGPTTLVTDG